MYYCIILPSGIQHRNETKKRYVKEINVKICKNTIQKKYMMWYSCVYRPTCSKVCVIKKLLFYVK